MKTAFIKEEVTSNFNELLTRNNGEKLLKLAWNEGLRSKVNIEKNDFAERYQEWFDNNALIDHEGVKFTDDDIEFIYYESVASAVYFIYKIINK